MTARIGDEDWGIEAGRFGEGLAIVALVFGGLSVIAHWNAADWGGFSSPLKFALWAWDSTLRFAFSPLLQLLESLIEQLRAFGFQAALQPFWYHSVAVTFFVGVSGLQATAKGSAWILGVAWLVVVCFFGFAVLSDTNVLELASALGSGIGGPMGGSLLVGTLTVMMWGFFGVLVVVGLWFYLYPFEPIGLLFAVCRVFACFIGAGIYLLLDYAVRSLVA